MRTEYKLYILSIDEPMKEWIKLHAPISVTTLNLRCFLCLLAELLYHIVSYRLHLPPFWITHHLFWHWILFWIFLCPMLSPFDVHCTAHCTALTVLPPTICVWRVIANLVMLFAPLRTNAIKWFSMFCLLFIFILLILTRWLYRHLVYNSFLGCSRYSLLLQTTPYHGISGGNSITLNLFTFVSPRGV